ncbi:MAG: hypothetical protein IJI20_03935 [Firmicutes bacterium]|nr:hypothetical protein [Bacillota bacterium]
MEGLKKPLSRALSLALMMAMAFFGMLAITQAVYADEADITFTLNGLEVSDENLNNPTLYSDSSREYGLVFTHPDGGSYTDGINISLCDGVDSEKQCELQPGQDGQYLRTVNSLTLKGEAIWSLAEAKGYDEPYLEAQFYIEDEDDEWIAEAIYCISVDEAGTELEFGPDEESLEGIPDEIIQGDYFEIYPEGFATTYNNEYPDGDVEEIAVTGVACRVSDPMTVVKRDGIYVCTASENDTGTAKLTVSYRTEDMEQTDPDRTETYQIEVKDNIYWVWADTETGSHDALPGAVIALTAGGGGERDFEGEKFTFKWNLIDEGNAGSTLTPNENDSSRAVLKTGNTVGEDGSSVLVNIKLYSSRDRENPVAEDTIRINIWNQYYEIHPLKIERQLALNDSLNIIPELWRYSTSNRNGTRITNGVSFQVESGNDDDDFEWSERNGVFTITRMTTSELDVKFTALLDSESICERNYYFDEISYDLGDYQVVLPDAVDGWKYYVEGAGTIVPQVRVEDDGIVLREGVDYELSFKKETFDSSAPEDEQWDFREEVEPPLGKGHYLVTATAKGDVYEGSTDTDFEIFDKYSVAPYGGEVEFDEKYYDDSVDKFYDYYIIPAGIILKPAVTVGKAVLTEGKDYAVQYWAIDSKDVGFEGDEWDYLTKTLVDGFPTTPGTYVCYVIGKGKYSGNDSTSSIVRFTIENNPTGKARADAVTNQINSLNQANPNENAVKQARAAYNALPEKGFISAATLNKLVAAEKRVVQIKAEANRQAAIAAAAKAAEDARQGIYDPTIPKVKAKKPAAKKAKITAKWTKLKKKQLKKSKATNYEIWVCPNTGFAKGDTIERIVGKGKASIKVGGLQKNTRYFVKVRAIKYENGKKYVGPWNQKSVKTKKK